MEKYDKRIQKLFQIKIVYLILIIIAFSCASCNNNPEDKVIWDFYQIFVHLDNKDSFERKDAYFVFDIKIINRTPNKVVAPNINNTYIYVNNEKLSLSRSQIFGYFRDKETTYINPCDSVYFRVVLYSDDLKKYNLSLPIHPNELLEALTINFEKEIISEDIKFKKNPTIYYK